MWLSISARQGLYSRVTSHGTACYSPEAMIEFVDVRVPGRLPTFKTGKKKGKVRAYRGRRDPHEIDRVCVHHLGPHLSAEPKRGQTRIERAVQRARAQPYQVWAQPDIVVMAWDLLVATWHGNGANRTSVGLVVAGRFSALAEDFDPKIHDVAEEYAEALDAALARLVAELPSLRYVVTHSQYARKPADPGELIARAAARSGEALGLRTLPDLSVGTGKPWPPEWRRP